MKRSMKWSHGALGLTLTALAMVAMGCGGGQHAESTSGVSGGQDAVAASASLPAPPVTSSGGSSTSGSEQISTVTNDSMPPDVSASVADSLVTPGTVIEVMAKSSPDVEEVLLADGFGKPQKFAYDPASDTWRASYRVPVRFPGERLGLAVTAKNNVHRWRRVWVFLGVEGETPKDSAQVEEK